MTTKTKEKKGVYSTKTINDLTDTFSEYFDYYDALKIFKHFGLLEKYMPKDNTGGKQTRTPSNELIYQAFCQLNENKDFEVIGSFGEFGLSRLMEYVLNTLKRSTHQSLTTHTLEDLIKRVKSILASDHIYIEEGHRKYWVIEPNDIVTMENAHFDVPDDTEEIDELRLHDVKKLTIKTSSIQKQNINIRIAYKNTGISKSYIVEINGCLIPIVKKSKISDGFYKFANGGNVSDEEYLYKTINSSADSFMQKYLLRVFKTKVQIIQKSDGIISQANNVKIKVVKPQTIEKLKRSKT